MWKPEKEGHPRWEGDQLGFWKRCDYSRAHHHPQWYCNKMFFPFSPVPPTHLLIPPTTLRRQLLRCLITWRKRWGLKTQQGRTRIVVVVVVSTNITVSFGFGDHTLCGYHTFHELKFKPLPPQSAPKPSDCINHMGWAHARGRRFLI